MRSLSKATFLLIISLPLLIPISITCMNELDNKDIEKVFEDKKSPCCSLTCCSNKDNDCDYFLLEENNKKKLTCNALTSIKKLFEKKSKEANLEDGLWNDQTEEEEKQIAMCCGCCPKARCKKIATESLELTTKGSLAYLSLYLYGTDSLTFFAQNHFAQNIARHLPSKKRYIVPTITALYFASIGSKLIDGYLGFETDTHIIGLLTILNVVNGFFSKINQPSTPALTQDEVRNIVMQALEEEKNK